MKATSVERILLTMNLGNVKIMDSGVKCICPDWYIKHDTSMPSSGLSFSVSFDDYGPSYFFCFVCSKKGLLVNLVRQMYEQNRTTLTEENVKQIEEIEKVTPEKLIEKGGYQLERKMLAQQHIKEYVSYRNSAKFAYGDHEWTRFSNEYHPYAAKRGISKQTWEELDLRFDPKEKRIIQAIRREDGKLVNIVGRAINNSINPRHLTYFPGPKLWIYREHEVAGEAFLFEGPLKAALAYEKGIKNAISLQGSKFSKEQLDFLKKYDIITLCLDADLAGNLCAEKLVNKLFDTTKLFLVDLKPGEELEEFDVEGIKQRVEKRIPIFCNSLKRSKSFYKNVNS